jgi:hypothetical protein
MGSIKALLLGAAEPSSKDKKKTASHDEEESGEYEVGSDEEHGQALLDAIDDKDAAAVGKAMKAVAMACMADDDSEEEEALPMPRTVTRTELVLRARRRAKMENSTFVSSAEMNTLVDESVAELYDLLIAARGQEYYRSGARLFTIPGTVLYELPPDFYKALAVTIAPGRVIDSTFNPATPAGLFFATTVIAYDDSVGDWRAAEPFMMSETAALRSSRDGGPYATRYRLGGLQLTNEHTAQAYIELRPAPRELFTVQLDYIPTCSKDEVGAIVPEVTWDGIDGWEEYVVLDVAITMLGMEESSTAHLERKLDRMRERLTALADNRDAGRPERIQDVTGAFDAFDDIPRRPSGAGWVP